MRAPSPLPAAGSGPIFLTEGGSETEIMYRHGFELPEFAMFPLLENPAAITALRDMFRAQLDVAAEFCFGFLFTGLDYRASPDWGAKLGYSATALADANITAIAFLREIADDYRGRIPSLLIGGILGPRGDAYGLNREMTAEGAEAYHAVQLETLKRAEVDFACAMTFNNIPEAVGAARAAARTGVPLSVSLTLDRTHRLKSGPTLGEAITGIDTQAGLDSPDYYLGEQQAAITLAGIYQRSDQINNAGGYLRSLTERARDGKFSAWPMIMALLRAKLDASKQAPGVVKPGSFARDAGEGGLLVSETLKASLCRTDR